MIVCCAMSLGFPGVEALKLDFISKSLNNVKSLQHGVVTWPKVYAMLEHVCKIEYKI